MPDTAAMRSLEAVLRSLATAARSLRLYPATSPIPLESVQAVRTSLAEYFVTGADPLGISLAREGFSVDGVAIGAQIPGARDLSDELRAHGIAEIEVSSEVSGEELLTFLTVIERSVEDARADGGVAALAAAGGVRNLRIAEVRLAVIDEDENAEDFLRDLSQDPGGLAEWYAAASAGDPASFAASLMDLVRATDSEDESQLVRSLGKAFRAQPPAGQDALLALAMTPGPVRDLVGDVFENFDAAQIAGSILSGAFGKNMLSLSNALTKLPLEEVATQVRAELEEMLARAGHGADERDFLDHMLDVRSSNEPEPALVATDRTYNAVLAAATLSDLDVARAREAVAASGQDISVSGVRAMLAILDQQTDFERYSRSAENLAGSVPYLLEQGNFALASRVVAELRKRETHNAEQWPELPSRIDAALAVAAGPRSMSALVQAVAADSSLMGAASEIVLSAGDSSTPTLVAEAIALKGDGLLVAEQLLGRRLIDLLNVAAPETPWHQLGPVVQRLATAGDPRSVATIEGLMQRPDEQSRRELIGALASVRGPLSNRLLATALRDPQHETATAAARAIARSGEPGSAALLAARLDELDMDRADFLLAKELIGALARTPEPSADEVLDKLGARHAFIKRGHFTDIQSLVAEARRARKGGISR
ncbi:MAG: HEAT repeat domain-containing protein [Coriobacteriia bacterium]